MSVNQSIFIYIRQQKPILVDKPIHIKNTHSTVQYYHTDENRKKLSHYWSETSAAENHTCIF